MTKNKTLFFCRNCGSESPKWVGQCPSCKEWNTLQEETVVSGKKDGGYQNQSLRSTPKKLTDIEVGVQKRVRTGISELDRILGGGIVPGALILLGGEPGIGKSTLALQVAVGNNELKCFYVSGEESEQQIRLRAERISALNQETIIFCDTDLDEIRRRAADIHPDLLIVDSIQTLNSAQFDSGPGSVTQVRECTSGLLRFAKENGIPVLLIGHINKEGNIAGPKVLEHIVDTVLQFEGDQHHFYRLLRVQKNRFGATSELALFEMAEKGLKEILNPSDILINQSDQSLSGISVAAAMDGLKPFLIEVQSLVSSAVYGTPQRTPTGIDVRRLNMLLAVLEKRAGFNLGTKDVFINIAGGLKVVDPAIDLAIIVAILSSAADISVPKNVCFVGEVGLSGEIRPVSRVQQRINEAEKLGFNKIFLSSYNEKNIDERPRNIKLIFLNQVGRLPKMVFDTKE